MYTKLENAKTALQTGRQELAYRLCVDILSCESAFVDGWLFLACIYRNGGRYDLAVLAQKHALTLDPNNAQVRVQLISDLYQADKPSEALDILKTFLLQNPNMITLYARLLLESDRADLALVSLELPINKNHASEESRYLYAKALSQLGNVNNAIVFLQRIIQTSPISLQASNLLVDLLVSEGRLEEAIEALLCAVEIECNNYILYAKLGDLYLRTDKHNLAAESFKNAQRCDPNQPSPFLREASILDANESYDEAILAYQKYFRLDPIKKTVLLTLSSEQSLPRIPLSCLTESLSLPEGVQLIPSYLDESTAFGAHMVFSHIPKTAGMRFSTPISACISNYYSRAVLSRYSATLAQVAPRGQVVYIHSDRIDSLAMYRAMLSTFPEPNDDLIDFSFLVPHAIDSSGISKVLSQKYQINPIRLAIWRDPRDRLISALRYLWRSSGGDTELLEIMIRNNHSFLDNSIHKAYYADSEYHANASSKLNTNIDYLININSFFVLDQIMSFYLSRCRLPNLIISSRINATKDSYNLSSSRLNDLYLRCVDKGFIENDLRLYSQGAVIDYLPPEFQLSSNASTLKLHPLTIIIKTDTADRTTGSGSIIPTELLLSEDGKKLLVQTFA